MGVITFKSLHPKWSYVLMGDEGVIQPEKQPISDTAIAGFITLQPAVYGSSFHVNE